MLSPLMLAERFGQANRGQALVARGPPRSVGFLASRGPCPARHPAPVTIRCPVGVPRDGASVFDVPRPQGNGEPLRRAEPFRTARLQDPRATTDHVPSSVSKDQAGNADVRLQSILGAAQH